MIYLTRKAAQTAVNNQFGRLIELLLKSLEKKPHGDKGALPGFDIRHVSQTCFMMGIDGYAIYCINLHNNPSQDKVFSFELEQVSSLVKLTEATTKNFGYNSRNLSRRAVPSLDLFDGFIFNVDPNVDHILKWIDEIVTGMRGDVMEVFSRAISRTRSEDIQFEIDYETYYDGPRIILDKEHIKDEMDTRFVKMNNIHKVVNLRIYDYTTPKAMLDAVNQTLDEFQKAVDGYVAKYKEIVDSVGGTELIIDGKLILTHRDFDPIVTGGFITFMCPYNKTMISMKSTNIECIEVRHYGRGQLSEPVPTSIVAITHQ